MNAHQELVYPLIPEAFQAERSACRHPRLEARRLGIVPPADALLAVAVHADTALARLTTVTDGLGLRSRAAGQVIGVGFSVLRNRLGDPLLDAERSYRGTLLGIRHTIDIMRLLAATSRRVPGLRALVELCDEWLPERTRLWQECLDNLEWFAANPHVARRPVWAAQLRQVGRMLDGVVAAGVRRGLAG